MLNIIRFVKKYYSSHISLAKKFRKYYGNRFLKWTKKYAKYRIKLCIKKKHRILIKR